MVEKAAVFENDNRALLDGFGNDVITASGAGSLAN